MDGSQRRPQTLSRCGGTHSGICPSFSDSLLSGISFTWNTCLHALQGTSEAVWPGGRSPRWRRAGPISLCDRRKQVPSSSPAGILNPNHRTRASASHSTPPPKLLRCLQGKRGGGQPRPPPHGQSGGLEPVIVSDPEWPAFFPHEHPGIILPQQNTKTPATTELG